MRSMDGNVPERREYAEKLPIETYGAVRRDNRVTEYDSPTCRGKDLYG